MPDYLNHGEPAHAARDGIGTKQYSRNISAYFTLS